MATTIALAGNPNCGKTTMFNALTGANQYVGNWPGVTVERKEGRLKKSKDTVVTDLPGIYSLSPYTQEEVVSRDYLMSNAPDVILNIVDATNIERNLYLTTQLLELGKPTVIALNMMDALKKSGDTIDVQKLSEKLGVVIVETQALYGKGVQEAAQKAVELSKSKATQAQAKFADDVEKAIADVTALLPTTIADNLKRWYAIKLIERDQNVNERLTLSESDKARVEEIVKALETARDNDSESIITDERYNYITAILKGVLTKSGKNLTLSDKIDRIVTNRILGLPIFLLVMWAVYYISVTTVGTMATDWTNDDFVGGIMEAVQGWMEGAGANPILTDALVNGVIGGVGAVVGFAPQMFILFVLLSFIEDCGYMVRIAFVMDRIFRRFGLSGKSFIPLLVSSGCGIPGIMASKTIENDNDRRLTIMTTTWVPCGAKLPVIACMAGVIAAAGGFGSWVAPGVYALGIGSVLLAAIMLKKTKPFHGEAAPFVMELPQYHMPQIKTVLMHAWERTKGFLIKAGTILFLACLAMWFLSTYGWETPAPEAEETATEQVVEAPAAEEAAPAEEAKAEESAEGEGEEDAEEEVAYETNLSADTENLEFGIVENSANSILARIGNKIRYIFIPLGFGGEEGGWQAAAASLSGFSAKEAIVGTMAVLAGGNDAAVEEASGAEDDLDADNPFSKALKTWFPSALAAFCFLLFNLLDSPCLAAIATMARELNNRKWFWFAVVFQNVWAWVITFIIYQIGSVITGAGFGVGTVIAVLFLAGILFQLFRPDPYKGKTFAPVRSVDAIAKQK
jgi:ferrous iron transport protein B